MDDKRLIDALHVVIGILMYRAGETRIEFDEEESQKMLEHYCKDDETMSFDLTTGEIVTMTINAEKETA